HADAHHYRSHGDPLYRYESHGQRLLHLEAAPLRDFYVPLRLHHSVGLDDHHRHLYQRAWLAMVLAGANMGSQSTHLRGEPRSAGSVRHHLEPGQSHFWISDRGRLLRAGRIPRLLAVPSLYAEGFQAHEPAAILDH